MHRALENLESFLHEAGTPVLDYLFAQPGPGDFPDSTILGDA